MFICSLRASTLKFFGVTTVALAALVTLLVFIPAEGTAVPTSGSLAVNEAVRFDKIKTAEDRVEFLASLGYSVEATPTEEAAVTIPAEFDKIYKAYNELQKAQGFDLTPYHKKEVMRYTYKLTSFDGSQSDVFATILVHKNRVIGGDLSSADFVSPLVK